MNPIRLLRRYGVLRLYTVRFNHGYKTQRIILRECIIEYTVTVTTVTAIALYNCGITPFYRQIPKNSFKSSSPKRFIDDITATM